MHPHTAHVHREALELTSRYRQKTTLIEYTRKVQVGDAEAGADAGAGAGADGSRLDAARAAPAQGRRVPDVTVSDPMRDGAVFNQPLDPMSLEASDFPMLEIAGSSRAGGGPGKADAMRTIPGTNLVLGRTTSDGQAFGSNSGVAPDAPPPALQRRPRRLTKGGRVQSDTTNERPEADAVLDGAPDKMADKASGVVTKKTLQSRSSPADAQEPPRHDETTTTTTTTTTSGAPRNGGHIDHHEDDDTRTRRR